jgi:hypothetical protein
LAITSIDAVLSPGHTLSFDWVMDDVNALSGSTTSTVSVAVHPLASVTVTDCEPAESVVAELVVSVLLHRYDFDPVPPVELAVAVELLPPLQVTGVGSVMLTSKSGLWVTLAVVVAVQPLASVAVTLYVPADRPVMVVEVEPVLQTKVFVPVPPVPAAVAVPSLPS